LLAECELAEEQTLSYELIKREAAEKSAKQAIAEASHMVAGAARHQPWYRWCEVATMGVLITILQR
jgi:hypothetical protein